MQFGIDWSDEGGARIAAIEGRIDSTNAGDFEANMNQGVGDNTNALIMDLSQLSFMSSAGLRVLLRMAKAFRAPRTLSVCGLSELLAEIFNISGFDQIVTIHDSKATALDAIGSG